MDHDVIIIGGSFAGQAAAMMLGRARRNVLLVDAASPRNRFASHAHGFIGQDGVPPAEIIAKARAELSAYPDVTQLAGTVTDAVAIEDGFEITLADDSRRTARRLILATGIRDVLPDLPGLSERWGQSVLHCPYCHGYELDQQPIGVLATSPHALHQAMLVPDWGPTTFFTQGMVDIDDEQNAALSRRGVTLEHTPVTALHGPGTALETVELADGRHIPVSGLFIGAPTELVSDLPVRLGLALTEGMAGPLIEVDDMHQTSLPGVFAAGDATLMMANATIAAASGVKAGARAHASLIHGH